MLAKSIILTLGAFLIAAGVVLYARPDYRGMRSGREDENYLVSNDCRSCHADHYSSWARTFQQDDSGSTAGQRARRLLA